MSTNNEKLYKYTFKCIMIGDSGVGKSSILNRFTEDRYSESFISTIGIDFKVRSIDINKQMVKLQIWDTAGQERYQSITQSYYRNVRGIFLVYDVTNITSFDNIKSWIEKIEKHNQVPHFITLVGNKADIVKNRMVTFEMGKKYADQNGFDFYETSAKKGEEIDIMFINMAKKLIEITEVEKKNTAAEKKLMLIV